MTSEVLSSLTDSLIKRGAGGTARIGLGSPRRRPQPNRGTWERFGLFPSVAPWPGNPGKAGGVPTSFFGIAGNTRLRGAWSNTEAWP